MFRNLRNYFITGLLVILPAILTFVILAYLVIKTNELILQPITNILMESAKPFLATLPDIYLIYLGHIIQILVFILLLVAVTAVGVATKIFVFRKSFGSLEYLLQRIPMVGKIYISIKQLSHAFLGQKTSIFERVVLLEYPRRGIYSLGFVTCKAREEVQDKTKPNMISVFLPTTPNPTSGVFLLVPEDQLTYLDMTVEEGLRLVISGGKVTPDYKKEIKGD